MGLLNHNDLVCSINWNIYLYPFQILIYRVLGIIPECIIMNAKLSHTVYADKHSFTMIDAARDTTRPLWSLHRRLQFRRRYVAFRWKYLHHGVVGWIQDHCRVNGSSTVDEPATVRRSLLLAPRKPQNEPTERARGRCLSTGPPRVSRGRNGLRYWDLAVQIHPSPYGILNVRDIHTPLVFTIHIRVCEQVEKQWIESCSRWICPQCFEWWTGRDSPSKSPD